MAVPDKSVEYKQQHLWRLAKRLCSQYYWLCCFNSPELHWGHNRVMPKLSFHSTAYAPLDLEIFGESLAEQMLKEYNDQIHWLLVDISSLYPNWLNLAAGQGLEK